MNELLAWCDENAPALACSLAYCVTADDMRKILNAHTGLDIQPNEKQDAAAAKWLQVLAG